MNVGGWGNERRLKLQLELLLSQQLLFLLFHDFKLTLDIHLPLKVELFD